MTYAGANRLLHWLMAALILGLLTLGYYMTYVADYGLYHLHKSVAVVVALLLLPRLVLRWFNPWQSTVKGKGAKAVHGFHWLLLVLLVIMVVSGAAYSGFGGYGIALFDWPLLAQNIDAQQQVVAHSAALSDWGLAVHIYCGWALCFTLAIHALAALKHHFIDRDGTLIRMLVGEKGARL